jgi:hypothetical protein
MHFDLLEATCYIISALLFGDPQLILDQQLRPHPSYSLNTIITTLINGFVQ